MANVKVTDLPEDTTPADGDLLMTVDVSASATKKVTRTNLFKNPPIADAAITPAMWTNPYKFSVYRNAAANTGNNAFAKITFDTENYDSNNNFTGGTYTVPVNGFYMFTWSGYVTTTATNQSFIISLYKNGSIVDVGHRVVCPTNGGIVGGKSAMLVQCTAGDTMDVYAYATATLALDVGSGGSKPAFTGYLVTLT